MFHDHVLPYKVQTSHEGSFFNISPSHTSPSFSFVDVSSKLSPSFSITPSNQPNMKLRRFTRSKDPPSQLNGYICHSIVH